MAFTKNFAARVAGRVQQKFPQIAAMTVDSIVSETILDIERLKASGVRADAADHIEPAPAQPATNHDAELDRDRARQDAALAEAKSQSRGGRA